MYLDLTPFRQSNFILCLSLSVSLFVSQSLYAQDENARPHSGTVNYNIDPDRSILKVFVGRAGLLSEMGHNHIVTNRSISGEIEYTPAPGISTATLTLPVADFIIDDETERQLAGDGYESVPSESDIQGTQDNMLSEGLLDSENHREIRINISGETYLNSQNIYDVQLAIKDSLITLKLDTRTQRDGDILNIDAFFVLSHAQLNLRPFSVLGGMLKVAEQMRFELHLEGTSEK